jgi:hypothetical protein
MGYNIGKYILIMVIYISHVKKVLTFSMMTLGIIVKNFNIKKPQTLLGRIEFAPIYAVLQHR